MISTMSTIQQLPSELLIAILEENLSQLRKESPASNRAFFQSIRCCKRWYIMGMPILFNTIVLQYPQLSLREPLYCDPSHLLLAKSLVVQARATDFKSHRELHRRLRDSQIDKTLPLRIATQLTSFSLVFTVFQTPGNWHPSLSVRSVKTLLECLPSSIVNLDLDVPGLGVSIRPAKPGQRIGYNSTVLDESRHLCSTLAPILWRLKSLRIRASMICEDLFACLAQDAACFETQHEHTHEERKSSLQKLIIRLDPWNAAHATRHCRDDSEKLLPNWSNISTLPLSEHLATTLLTLWKAGRLPHLQTCKIVEFATETVRSPIRLDVFFNMLQGAPNKEYMMAFPARFRNEQYFRVTNVLQDQVTMIPYLQHARTTADFGNGKRSFEVEAIDWESRDDIEEIWSWI
jgi:hypothetical protein